MTRWTSEVVRDDVVVFRVGREGSRFVAEWPGTMLLACDRTGEHVEIVVAPTADAAVVEKLRLGAVPALIGHLGGRVTLHAAAVARGDRVLAFTGASGVGKSTLVAHLLADPSWAFVSDDLLGVEISASGVLARPSTHEVSWLDEGTGRRVVRPARRAATAARLEALIDLRFDQDADEPVLDVLTGAAAVAVASSALVRFVVDEPAVHMADLDRVAMLIHNVRVLRLRRPRAYDRLDATAQRLCAFVSGGIDRG